MLSLLELFVHVDDFCQQFLPKWKATLLKGKKRNRARSLSESEIITIVIAFHQSGYRTFKHFYLRHVCQNWTKEFPNLVSYNRFIEYIPSVLIPLFYYLRSLQGQPTGIAFIDSTALAVCNNRRIRQHKVFKGVAKRGKNSTGWFFGFKVHLVVSDTGELLNFTLTTGDVDDRKPVPGLLAALFGKVFGDKGYISQALKDLLAEQGIQLITKVRKKMKPQELAEVDKVLLRKRALIETIIDQFKNVSVLEHSRHRAYSGFLWNVATALIAYCHQPKKPSLHLNFLTGMVLA
jgi:hypothetical protein